MSISASYRLYPSHPSPMTIMWAMKKRRFWLFMVSKGWNTLPCPVLLGLFQKPWNKDPRIPLKNNQDDPWKVSEVFFVFVAHVLRHWYSNVGGSIVKMGDSDIHMPIKTTDKKHKAQKTEKPHPPRKRSWQFFVNFLGWVFWSDPEKSRVSGDLHLWDQKDSSWLVVLHTKQKQLLSVKSYSSIDDLTTSKMERRSNHWMFFFLFLLSKLIRRSFHITFRTSPFGKSEDSW